MISKFIAIKMYRCAFFMVLPHYEIRLNYFTCLRLLELEFEAESTTGRREVYTSYGKGAYNRYLNL